jgi:hypothetical protein
MPSSKPGLVFSGPAASSARAAARGHRAGERRWSPPGRAAPPEAGPPQLAGPRARCATARGPDVRRPDPCPTPLPRHGRHVSMPHTPAKARSRARRPCCCSRGVRVCRSRASCWCVLATLRPPCIMRIARVALCARAACWGTNLAAGRHSPQACRLRLRAATTPAAAASLAVTWQPEEGRGLGQARGKGGASLLHAHACHPRSQATRSGVGADSRAALQALSLRFRGVPGRYGKGA